MAKHVKYGGSTAARTIGCPAWHRLAEEVPQKTEGANPAADEGTMLHNAMEIIFDDCDTLASSESIEAAIEALWASDHHYKDEVLTRDLIDEKLRPAILATIELLDSLEIDDYILEPFVAIDKDIGGSIDMIGRSADGKTILVNDYKFGYHGVNAEGNKQLLFYTLCAASDGETQEWFDTVERIVLAITQPNNDGDIVDTWEISMEDVDNFESQYLQAVEDSEEPDCEPNAGAWCKFCPAHATCPVKTGLAAQVTRVNEITADKLAEYLPLVDKVEAWAKEVKKMAHEQLELGTPIRGYKLVNKRATRTWNDTQAVEDKIRKAKKIKLEDGFDMKLKSPAQLEKVCKKLNVDFDQYGDYISSVSSGTTLAREDDPRPAALPVQGLAQLNAMND